MTTSPDIGLPQLVQGQASPDVTFNEAFVLLQAMLKGVIDKDLTAPPGSPTEGDSYLIASSAPTGAWAGMGKRIAIYWGGAWRFVPGRDDAGTPIAMGARQEGIHVFVNDENKMYIFGNTVGSPATYAWYPQPAGTVAATDVTNTPAGNIAATNVQAAINELDTEKVAKAGDTMTGALEISYAATGVAQNDAPLRVISTDSGANGASIIRYANSASPAANDHSRDRWYFNNSLGNPWIGGQTGVIVDSPTSGAENAHFIFATTRAGALGFRMLVGNGVYSSSLSDMGDNTINFSDYYDDGVNLTSIYARLGVANTFSLNGGGAIPVTIRAVDNGATGPVFVLQHQTASPAATDRIAVLNFRSTNSSGGTIDYTQVRGLIVDPTASSEDGEYAVFNMIGGSQLQSFTVGAGGYFPGTTGGDMGYRTLNASAVYDDGVIICAPLHMDDPEKSTQEFWDTVVPDMLVETKEEYTYFPPILSDVVKDPKTGEPAVLVEGKNVRTKDAITEIVPTKHRTAKRHFTMIAEGFDATDPDNYFARLDADRAVPGMPTLAEHNQRYPVVDAVEGGRKPVDKYSVQERTERTSLALDYMALTMRSMWEELKTLRERVAELEAK